MAPVFIFTKDVQKILDTGKREIAVPKGARISPAAQDLIKDHQMKIHFIGDREDAPVDVSSDSSKGISAPHAAGRLSDEELENIVSRVVKRFKETQAQGPSKTVEKEEAADDDLVICRCEEITKGEIKDVIKNGMETLNGIKRITRAGMGLCQGQTCQRLVKQILATELHINPSEIKPTTARAPVRPISLSAFSTG